ncbi:hypothetical protein C8T65DRAFT_57902 [Cerioporus squamosus]|nr:hypothetical protein C8T65DRAFT_57902 [Cerioporus squamosus]
MHSCDQSRGLLPGTVLLAEASAAGHSASLNPPLPPCNDIHRLAKSAAARRATVASREAPVDITSFPIELLSELFSYLAWTRPLETDLVVATHVCRLWRIAALGNPLLWAHVSATSLSKARAFFERSKFAPLNVHISSPDDVEAMLNLLRSNSARVRSLHVETSDLPTTAQCLLHLSQMHVPILESLRLDGPQQLSDPSTMRILHTLQSRCGQEHWSSCTPLLRHLHIRSLGIPWEAPLYQNLSVLDLRAPGMPPPSIIRLLDILRQCPDLESFALQTPMLSESSVLATDREGMVYLPLLRTFHLVGPPPARITEILEHLTLPPTTRYSLSTVDIPILPSQYSVLPDDRSRLPGLSSFRAIDFKQVSPRNILLRCSHTTPDDPVLTLAVSVTDIPAGLVYLSRAVDVTAAHSLSISLQEGTEITFADWSDALCDFTSLSTLRLVGASNNTVRSALGALWQPLVTNPTSPNSPPRSPAGSPARSLCEKLSELMVTEVETPCRVSTDLLWLCDERKRLGCDIRCVQTDADFLSDSCVNGLRTRGVELRLYDKSQVAPE